MEGAKDRMAKGRKSASRLQGLTPLVPVGEGPWTLHEAIVAKDLEEVIDKGPLFAALTEFDASVLILSTSMGIPQKHSIEDLTLFLGQGRT